MSRIKNKTISEFDLLQAGIDEVETSANIRLDRIEERLGRLRIEVDKQEGAFADHIYEIESRMDERRGFDITRYIIPAIVIVYVIVIIVYLLKSNYARVNRFTQQ